MMKRPFIPQPDLFSWEPALIEPPAPICPHCGDMNPTGDDCCFACRVNERHDTAQCSGCLCPIAAAQVWCMGCQHALDNGDDPDTNEDSGWDRCDYCDDETEAKDLIDARLLFPASWPGGSFLRVCPGCWDAKADFDGQLLPA